MKSPILIRLLLAAWLQGGGLTLQLQAVDGGWLPLPGITFQVQQVGSCGRAASPDDPKPQPFKTNSEGWASVPVRPNTRYRIVFDGEGGFERVEKCIQLGQSDPPQPRAFVQIQLHVKRR